MKNLKDPQHIAEQGKSTSDRSFINPKDDKKQHGISNSGGQLSNQTSNRDNLRKVKNKKGSI